MNKSFSTRITELRNERNLSQKDAAADLGISQALLSHYEKGIRECGLDFLCKAAAYYDVSCDYLLGMIETRRSFQEEFEAVDIEFDSEFRTSTLFRAATMLHDNFQASGNGQGEYIKQYFSLAIYKVALCAAYSGCIPKSWISLPISPAISLAGAKMNELSAAIVNDGNQKRTKNIEEPLCVKTIISASEKMISKDADLIINSYHT